MINILHFKNLNKIFLIFLIFFSACSNNGDEIIEEEEEKKISNLVPLGYSKFIFDSYTPLADIPIDVHTYLPDTTDTTIPVLFVMHGA